MRTHTIWHWQTLTLILEIVLSIDTLKFTMPTNTRIDNLHIQNRWSRALHVSSHEHFSGATTRMNMGWVIDACCKIGQQPILLSIYWQFICSCAEGPTFSIDVFGSHWGVSFEAKMLKLLPLRCRICFFIFAVSCCWSRWRGMYCRCRGNWHALFPAHRQTCRRECELHMRE